MLNLGAVALGGALGASLRYGLSLGVQRVVPSGWLPLGTLTVNVVGCLAIGWVAGWLSAQPLERPTWSLFAVTGLLGGFTTYSAFGYEVWSLWSLQQWKAALAVVLLHLVLGLLAVGLGLELSQRL